MARGEPGPDARTWMFLLHGGICHARECQTKTDSLEMQVNGLQSCLGCCRVNTSGPPTYALTEKSVQRYESRLEELSLALLKPWDKDGLLPSEAYPLLIIPSGRLFELPWSALPLRSGERLIDASIPGVLPGLGMALWSLGAPPTYREPNVGVILQAAPDTASGLSLPQDMVNWLRGQPVEVIEGTAANHTVLLRLSRVMTPSSSSATAFHPRRPICSSLRRTRRGG